MVHLQSNAAHDVNIFQTLPLLSVSFEKILDETSGNGRGPYPPLNFERYIMFVHVISVRPWQDCWWFIAFGVTLTARLQGGEAEDRPCWQWRALAADATTVSLGDAIKQLERA